MRVREHLKRPVRKVVAVLAACSRRCQRKADTRHPPRFAVLAALLLVLGLAASLASVPAGVARATAPARAKPPAGSPVPRGFEPWSASFVSRTTGFVLGVNPSCKTRKCASLVRTTNGGKSWVSLPVPAGAYGAKVSEVRFANLLDGWLFGPALYVTHDGASTWQRVNVIGTVSVLATAGGYVDAVVSSCKPGRECLEQASATGGPFVTVVTGPSGGAGISLRPPVGFVWFGPSGPPSSRLASKMYATGNLANLQGWNVFPDPCAGVRYSYLSSFVATSATTLYSVCVWNPGAGSETKDVVVTRDAKSHVGGYAPRAGTSDAVLAASPAGTLVMTARSGASWLYRSSDGGRKWSITTYNDGGLGWGDLGFITDSEGYVIHGAPSPAVLSSGKFHQLLMTHNGGASWRAVSIDESA